MVGCLVSTKTRVLILLKMYAFVKTTSQKKRPIFNEQSESDAKGMSPMSKKGWLQNHHPSALLNNPIKSPKSQSCTTDETLTPTVQESQKTKLKQ